MKLIGDDISLELTIAGYQFPEEKGGEWDANWLFIEGKGRVGPREWTFRDPCLTTFEVEEFIRWLEGSSRLPNKIFVEPNLRFTFSPPYLIVTIAHESAPPWKPRVVMPFPLNKNGFGLLATSLKSELGNFPFRGKPG